MKERDVYLRLKHHDIASVEGAQIPALIDHDDELWIVEMQIVSPPFVLDFAGAYLDRAPDWPDDVLLEWQEEKAEQFGDDWDRVQSIMATLRGHGIYLADVKPGNITL